MKFHLNVAQEGLRAGHKFISVLGLKWFSIDILPPTFDTSGGGGGYSVGNKYYTIRFTISLNGKVIKKEYTNLIVDEVIKISIMLKESFTSVFAAIKQISKVNKYINSKIKSNVVVEPAIKVSLKSDITIKVTPNDKNKS